MALRVKLFWGLAAVILPLLGGALLLSAGLFLRSQVALERSQMERNLRRIEVLLRDEQSRLAAKVYDWGAWDDTYEFVVERDERYLRSNWVPESFAGSQIDLMLITDVAGQVVAWQVYDQAQKEFVPVPADLRAHLEPRCPLLQAARAGQPQNAFLVLGGEPWLLAAHPILTSNDAGPSRGAYVMGRRVTEALLDQWRQATQLPLLLEIQGAAFGAALPCQAAHHQPAVQTEIRVLSRRELLGAVTIETAAPGPVFRLVAIVPRELLALALRMVLRLTLYFMGIAVLTLGAAWAMVERLAGRRLRQLAADVKTLPQADAANRPRPEPAPRRPDEISQLDEVLRQAFAELMRARAQLERFNLHLDEVREEEATRLARRIHDDLGQLVTVLRIGLVRIQQAAARGVGLPDLQARLLELLQVNDEMLQTLRTVAQALRPSVLDRLGLVEAVRWRVEQLTAQTELACELSLTGFTADDPPPERIGTALFRILQEALTNVIRHARARTVWIDLTADAAGYGLEVSDDGCGLAAAATQRPTFGLMHMQSRAAALGGTVTLTNRPAGGVCCRAWIPRTCPPGCIGNGKGDPS